MTALKELIRLEKHKWIAEYAPGKSYADLGGLWGTVNETITIAKLAGAKTATMADIQKMGNEWWTAFDERCEKNGVSDYECINIDICDTDSLKGHETYEFLHCSGIMYHVSDPIQFIQNLMTLTTEYLLISSMTIPEVIENNEGTLASPEGAAHLVHMMPEESRKILASYLVSQGMKADIVDQKKPSDLFHPNGNVKTGPWWWIYSPQTMEAMCEMCGLEIIKSDTNTNFSHSVLCKIPS